MKRFYSHYTFIYPDIYLKNYIVEMNDNRQIVAFFPFEKEIEKTEFYSGLLMFLPLNKALCPEIIRENIPIQPEYYIKKGEKTHSTLISKEVYSVYDEKCVFLY